MLLYLFFNELIIYVKILLNFIIICKIFFLWILFCKIELIVIILKLNFRYDIYGILWILKM